jgi:hypothetical protein
MSYEFLPRSCNRESSITCRCRILLSFYYPNNHFGIQTYKGNQMGPNITHKQFAYLNLVLDEVNHLYLSLSKWAVKPTSRSPTILASSYSSASTWGLEKNAVQLSLCKALAHILIINQQLLCHLTTESSAVSTVLQLPCEGQLIQPSSLSSWGQYPSNSPYPTDVKRTIK